jgi:hypothetical protein
LTVRELSVSELAELLELREDLVRDLLERGVLLPDGTWVLDDTEVEGKGSSVDR